MTCPQQSLLLPTAVSVLKSWRVFWGAGVQCIVGDGQGKGETQLHESLAQRAGSSSENARRGGSASRLTSRASVSPKPQDALGEMAVQAQS